jgi:hypothetical protein
MAFCGITEKSQHSLFCGQFLAASTNTLSKGLQHIYGILPVDTGIGDTDTVLETSLALCGNLLVA